MKLINALKSFLKPVAIVKYLFFPFMVANAGGTDVSTIIGANQTITAKMETENETWLGTNNGLWHISKDGKHVCHLTTANSVLPSNQITGICQTANGEVFASTNKGLLHFDGYTYTTISTENTKLPTNNISGIACDNSGYIWLATAQNGLVMLKGFKTWGFTSNNSALNSNSITQIKNDQWGNVIVTLDNNSQVAITDEGMVLIEQPIIADVIANKN
ncbi:MAG: two-component regulator propeller domain-containing protein [Chitinophagales bacterium]